MALNETSTNGIIDLNIDGIKKTQFRINGDDNAILELNLSDAYIGERLEKGYEVLTAEMHKIAELSEDDDYIGVLKKADKAMREQLDYIFDSNVSEVCGRGGSMYDPKDGMYRFEHIINALTKLYSNNLNSEFQKMKTRLSKYEKIPQDHKPKMSKSQKKRVEIQKEENE